MALTPGKWTFGPDCSSSGDFAVSTEDGRIVAKGMGRDDAKLLCAAKEMRDCLKQFVFADIRYPGAAEATAKRILSSLPAEPPTQAERDAARDKLVVMVANMDKLNIPWQPSVGFLEEIVRLARIAKGE